jgi:hypothetical protein
MSAETARILAGIESAITGQLVAADQGDYETVLSLGNQIDRLLKDALPFADANTTLADQLNRIVGLRRKLALKLALAKSESAGELARLRRGRAGLRGYHQGAGS